MTSKEQKAQVLEALQNAEEPQSVAQIVETTGVPKANVESALAMLVKEKKVGYAAFEEAEEENEDK